MTQIINPLALAYSSVAGVVEIAAPNIIIISGRCNWKDPAFQKARQKGAELWEYRNVVEASTTRVCVLDDEFYMGSAATCPRWPYPTPGARWIWQPTHTMTDIRVGKPFPAYVLNYLTERMRAGESDGFFLDVIGGRPWGKSDWTNWPQKEKDEWAAGVKDFMRQLDERRRAINPGFKILNNNTWQYNETCAQYVDGIMLEHVAPSNTYTVNWAGHEFGPLGQRRVMVIARTAESNFWKTVPGVTHIGEATDYGNVQPTTVPYAHVQQQDIEAKLREQGEPPPNPEPTPLSGIVATELTAYRIETNSDGTLTSTRVRLTPTSTRVDGDRCTIEAEVDVS
jgi:hypothetical protein